MLYVVSITMAVTMIATTARAFVQAPARCVMVSPNVMPYCRTNMARVLQRPRKSIPSLFSGEEPQATAAESSAVPDSSAVETSTDPATEASTTGVEEDAPQPPMTEQELARLEKIQEIERLRAKEKFITVPTGEYECGQCSFVYKPEQGSRGALPGTPFDDLPSTWLCPVCSAPKSTFVEQTKTIAGFEDNLQYGIGTNNLTGGQKNLLIFGSLAAFFALFLLGYTLE